MRNKPSGLCSRERINDLIAFSLIAVLVAVVFRIYWLDGWTLIGDSDRLNAFLNIRKFEVDNIHQYGYVPTWNERMFMGVSMAGLHYMLPGFGLLAYIEASFPQPYLFRVMTFVSMSLVILAGWAAYVFIKDVCERVLPAFVGAVLYCLSVYALHRIVQLDSSFAVLIHIPIAMLLIRRLKQSNMAITFAGLTLLASSLLIFTFLQEAVYAFVLFGAYACYQTICQRNLRSVTVLALAIGVAIVIGLPRVFTVYQDFLQLDRTKDFQQTSWIEIYRFFAEGFFGRFQGEGQSIRNGTNLHEGLQLIGSSFAAFLVVAGAILSPLKRERIAAVLLVLILSLVISAPLYKLYGKLKPTGHFPSLEMTIICVNAVVVAVWWSFKRWHYRQTNSPSSLFAVYAHSERDALFNILFLCFVLSVVVITEVRYLFYLAFLKVDFTHARLSIAGLLPLCTLAAIFLTRFDDGQAWATGKSTQQRLTVLAAALLAGLIVWLLEGSPLEWGLKTIGFVQPIEIAWNYALPLELARTVIALAIVIFLMTIARKFSDTSIVRHAIGAGLGFMIVFESVAYADFKLTGLHTTNYKAPFEKNNYMNVPPGVLRPPTSEQVDEIHHRLDPQHYRSVLVAASDEFPAFVAPHISNFWRLRIVDGYSAGVPWRLGRFDWPGDVRTLRALNFSSEAELPWALLAGLNVKYAVKVSKPFFYNAEVENGVLKSGFDPNRLEVIQNPFRVLPRHFFAESVVPRPPQRPDQESDARPIQPRGLNATALQNGAVLLRWSAPWGKDFNFRVEARSEALQDSMLTDFSGKEIAPYGPNDKNFELIGVVGPSGRTHLSPKLEPSRRWYFRLQTCRNSRCSDYTSPIAVTPALSKISAPRSIKLARTGPNSIGVMWGQASPTAYYRIEVQETVDDSFKEIVVTQSGQSSVQLKILDKDITKLIRIRACETEGCSAHSELIALASAIRVRNQDTSLSERLLPLPADFRKESYVEGFPQAKTFPVNGEINVNYEADHIDIKVTPAINERFLVVNELYHPHWRAFAEGRKIDIYPTNTVMRGIVVPPSASKIEFRFVPPLYRWQSIAVIGLGLSLLVVGCFVLRRWEMTSTSIRD